MHKILGSYNFSAFRLTCAAAAGAGLAHSALRTLKVSPWSPAGLALQAGAALASARFYPLAVSAGIQYALDKMLPQWARCGNQAVGAAIGFTIIMGAQWSWQEIAIKAVCAFAVNMLHIQLFEQIDYDRLLKQLPQDPREVVRSAPTSQLNEIANNLSDKYLKTPAALAFLDEFCKRDDIDDRKTRMLFMRFSSETIREFDPKELSDETVRKFTSSVVVIPIDQTYQVHLLNLLHCMRTDPKRQIAISQQWIDWIGNCYVPNSSLFGDQYPMLADETIDFIMQNNPNACQVAYCARQRKDLAPRLAEFTSFELIKVTPEHGVYWEDSLIKVVVELLPDEELLKLLHTLHDKRSIWLAKALRYALTGKVQIDDATLIKWADSHPEAACVVVEARPDLYTVCSEGSQFAAVKYIQPGTLINVIRHTNQCPLQVSSDVLRKAFRCTLQNKKLAALQKILADFCSQHRGLSFFLNADLSMLKSLNMESWDEHHRCYALARGIELEIDNPGSLVDDFKALYAIWHRTDTHFFSLNYFLESCHFIKNELRSPDDIIALVQGNKNEERVLLWMARFIEKSDGFEEVPEDIVKVLKTYQVMYGRILGLWERGREARKERLQFIVGALNLSVNSRFYTSYKHPLIETYKDFISYQYAFTHFLNQNFSRFILLVDPASRSLASHLACEDGAASQTTDWPAPAPFKGTPRDVFFKICHLLSAIERYKLAKVCKGLSTIIFKTHHQQVWRDLGSLRAINNMYMLYKSYPGHDREAHILRQAILFNLPHLRRK
ncbi:MAG: hypothetical protein ABSA17_01420 [Rhabdochlamydiaceae bacterium]|jgi:hypothetical protein